MSGEKILIVDDEREITELVKDYLENEGYEVIMAFDGEEGLRLYHDKQPDLAVLDIMLPKLEGTELCRQIRNHSTIPIIMLSAKKNDIDKVLSLGLGADDYMTKPFSPSELVARVKAHLRRYFHLSEVKAKNETLKYLDLELDTKGHNAYVAGKAVELSAKEFSLLSFLATSQGQVFTREQIFNQVWGYDDFGDINTITVHIRRLREKIEPNPAAPMYIKTVWGVGYKFGGK
ncbi:response regulator transcription factor [Desulfuribacillus alkaliarsenatis]|uniref:DNA-binding response regulator n=1 Tax=Desulfuribacillus alkaliarsenatis TaxID=766136 RepID=A0A1E5G1K5_9FIRM|nr:response regulator transcription factor [Desulfuribacillus alkaliarsenatis]OEF96716.1 DNA-binding response regulator [Desulfuribacillus alkaliarsenatis]